MNLKASVGRELYDRSAGWVTLDELEGIAI
jgi:hypothetical protein